MKLTKRQEAILIGSVLGDAFIQKTGEKNARIRFEHGAKQKEYLIWKSSQFGPLFQGKPSYLERKHPKSGEIYKYWRWQSNTSPILGKWQRYFYPNGVKQIPLDLTKILTEPISLAIWYMDDGYYSEKDKSSYIYLGRVREEEAVFAQKAIEKNFKIRANIYDKKKKGFALFFGVVETKKLHSLLDPYTLPSMQYKLSTLP